MAAGCNIQGSVPCEEGVRFDAVKDAYGMNSSQMVRKSIHKMVDNITEPELRGFIKYAKARLAAEMIALEIPGRENDLSLLAKIAGIEHEIATLEKWLADFLAAKNS